MKSGIAESTLLCVTVWCCSGLIVFTGFAFGREFIPVRSHPNRLPEQKGEPFANWDGYWYTQLVEHGYVWDPTRHSNVAFFPGYISLPVAIRQIMPLSAIPILVFSSNLFFLAALWPASRFGIQLSAEQPTPDAAILLAVCLWPMSVFTRVAYTESLFLLLIVTVLSLLRCRASMLLTALVAGAASGTRSVGAALLLPLLLDWWNRSKTMTGFATRAILLGPVACWGLLSYMGFLYCKFGDPFLFITAQKHWAARDELSWPANLLSLLTLEPIWTVYLPGSPAHWASHEHVPNALFSLQFWNPIYFVTCAGLVAYGAWKKWLTTQEWLLSVGLLGIPYALQGYRMMMLGHGRFTCVVFPMFIVLGRLISQSPVPVQAIIIAIMAMQLFYWAALFATWHRVF